MLNSAGKGSTKWIYIVSWVFSSHTPIGFLVHLTTSHTPFFHQTIQAKYLKYNFCPTISSTLKLIMFDFDSLFLYHSCRKLITFFLLWDIITIVSYKFLSVFTYLFNSFYSFSLITDRHSNVFDIGSLLLNNSYKLRKLFSECLYGYKEECIHFS